MRRVNELKISPHFLLMDFQCRCCEQVKIHPDLLEKMEILWEKTKGGFVITSGYRCEKHNMEVGGVKNSRHTMGRACDITAKNLKEVYEIVKSLGFRYCKIDEGKRYIHMEV
ncbi:MAG: hypothetical protein CBR30_06295 [Dictyoglomus sp. NZ13-RE01]|nr:MAG: hypothetical protein CBR30_06295 [Dictyoglomus sp. NZ13-RE01]